MIFFSRMIVFGSIFHLLVLNDVWPNKSGREKINNVHIILVLIGDSSSLN